MASGEENPVSGSRYRASGLFSCFGGSHAPDSGEAGRNGRPLRRGSAWLSRSRFHGKKRTVPVEISGDATMPCAEKHAGDMLEKKKKKGSKKRSSLFEKFRKEKAKGGGFSTKPHHNQLQKQHHPRPPPPPPPPPLSSHATASKCTTGNKPAPLFDPARVGIRTQTSHPSSPTTAPHNSRVSNGRSRNHLNPFMGLSVLTLALAVMLLSGKSCAILFMCAWFYLSQLLMPEPGARNDNVKKVDGVIDRDVDSDEYKKMVVLKGFLERDKRRTLHAS